MQHVRIFSFISSFLLATGCTSEQLYDFGRDVGQNKADCAALISYDERMRCEEAFSKDYEQYEAEREALNNPPKTKKS